MKVAKKVDPRAIIGAAVIFLIIGAVIFGAVYFMVLKPAADALESAKLSALSTVNQLSSIGTSKAISDASTYSSSIRSAGSKADVDSILSQVSAAIVREQKRKELLTLAATAANGTFYNAATNSELAQLQSTLEGDINSKQTLAELESYQTGEFNTKATNVWRILMNGAINEISGENVSMTVNSPPYGEFLSKENAISYVNSSDWTTLRKLKFEKATVMVPVIDTFKRAPTLKEGSVVKVYAYDRNTENMRLMFLNATVQYVIYSASDVGTISWTSPDGLTSYSLNVWETLKAAAGGSSSAAAIPLTEYGEKLVTSALGANIGSYDVNVIYVIKVSDTIGEEIYKYEFYQSGTVDVVLIPTV
ncbi:MAG: hypothetical protein ACK4GQ_01255 [Candidatus Hadarchaeales archaeon]